MEIKGNHPVGSPLPPTSEVGTAGAPKPAALNGDRLTTTAAPATAEAATALPPPGLPQVQWAEAQLRGAASFATQLGEVGQVSLAGDDLTAAFLKLQVGTDRQNCEYTNTLAQAKHLLAQLSIANARQMDKLLASNSEVQAVLRAILGQLERDLAKAVAALEDLQRKTLQQKADKREEKEEKGVSEEERARKFGKSSLKAMSAAAGAQVSTAVASSDPSGAAMTVSGLDGMRLAVAGAVGRLVAGNTDLARRRLG